MNNLQLFCDLAYSALSRSELDLRKLNENGAAADQMSVSSIGEAAIGFLIQKEAMRERVHLRGEHPYVDSRDKVDFCLFDDGRHPLASFEMKVLAADAKQRGWPGVHDNILKHFAPDARVKDASADH